VIATQSRPWRSEVDIRGRPPYGLRKDRIEILSFGRSKKSATFLSKSIVSWITHNSL
jgi:hypothetical protein